MKQLYMMFFLSVFLYACDIDDLPQPPVVEEPVVEQPIPEPQPEPVDECQVVADNYERDVTPLSEILPCLPEQCASQTYNSIKIGCYENHINYEHTEEPSEEDPVEEEPPEGDPVVSETNGDKKHVVTPDGDNTAYMIEKCLGGGVWGARQDKSFPAVCKAPVIVAELVTNIDWMEHKRQRYYTTHRNAFPEPDQYTDEGMTEDDYYLHDRMHDEEYWNQQHEEYLVFYKNNWADFKEILRSLTAKVKYYARQPELLWQS